MTRITPRTCLWPLAGSLSLTFALSIGLTFRSDHHCYAGTCGEWLFPLQARLHVVVWYCWEAISVTILAVRAFHPSIQKILRRPILERKLPILGKQLATSGILVLLWIISLYGIIIGIWWIRLHSYFNRRGIEGGVTAGNNRLAAIALTGHLCDVTMGMAILPISRHSALASFFKISVATTLTFHMITAYTLFILVLTHGFLYISWLPVFEALPETLRRVYPVLNPTYLYHEVWPGSHSSLGVWRASLIFTGIVATFIFFLIFITTLPFIRKRHFNLFYFTHLLGIVAIIIICLHASTMLYCTAPGLAMWLLDWAMRLYELWAPLDGQISTLGKGWYNLAVPLPRRRLDGCSCSSPLAHFYIHHSDSSIRELHPFTTITHLASQNSVTDAKHDDIEIQFLFRKRAIPAPSPFTHTATSASTSESEEKLITAPQVEKGFAPALFGTLRRMRRKRKATGQWTDRLAGLVVESNTSNTSGKSAGIPVSLRLEGPYFTPADPKRYRTVVCLVAGTGVSGALAISSMFRELERESAVPGGIRREGAKDGIEGEVVKVGEEGKWAKVVKGERVWTRCVVLWSLREDTHVEMPELTPSPTSSLEVHTHLTGSGRPRLDVGAALDEILDTDEKTRARASIGEGAMVGEKRGDMWVYISGPNPFIAAGEKACKARQGRGVEWYGARWDI